jgi:hypothetical protein
MKRLRRCLRLARYFKKQQTPINSRTTMTIAATIGLLMRDLAGPGSENAGPDAGGEFVALGMLIVLVIVLSNDGEDVLEAVDPILVEKLGAMPVPEMTVVIPLMTVTADPGSNETEPEAVIEKLGEVSVVVNGNAVTVEVAAFEGVMLEVNAGKDEPEEVPN